MSTTQAIDKPRSATVRDYLSGDKFKAEVALALPRHMSPDRYSRIALTALSRVPKLMECTPASILKCCMDLSAFGLEPDGRRAHLIPYENRKAGIVECQLIIDYKGYIELAKRGGEVKKWRAEAVKENDEFGWENGMVSHRIDWRANRGAAQCYYSHVVLTDGTDDYEVMTLEEVKAIRARSRAANSGPWVSDFDEMAKKTVIRRHSKRLTLSAEFMEAVAKDDEHNPLTTERNVTPSRRPLADQLGPVDQDPPDSAPYRPEAVPDIDAEFEREQAMTAEGGAL